MKKINLAVLLAFTCHSSTTTCAQADNDTVFSDIAAALSGQRGVDAYINAAITTDLKNCGHLLLQGAGVLFDIDKKQKSFDGMIASQSYDLNNPLTIKDNLNVLNYAAKNHNAALGIYILNMVSNQQSASINGLINQQDGEGRTPLMYAAYYPHINKDLLVLLLNLIIAGANVNVRDMYGKTALDLARETQTSLVQYQQQTGQRLATLAYVDSAIKILENASHFQG